MYLMINSYIDSNINLPKAAENNSKANNAPSLSITDFLFCTAMSSLSIIFSSFRDIIPRPERVVHKIKYIVNISKLNSFKSCIFK